MEQPNRKRRKIDGSETDEIQCIAKRLHLEIKDDDLDEIMARSYQDLRNSNICGERAIRIMVDLVNRIVFRTDKNTYMARVWIQTEYGGMIMVPKTYSFRKMKRTLSQFKYEVEHEDGRTENISVFDMWNKQPHPIRRTVYAPGCDVGPGVENLFYGPYYPREHCKEGDITPLLNHIMSYICRGVDTHFNYFVSWFAYVLQNPGKKPTTALVLQSFNATDLVAGIYKLSQVWGPLIKDDHSNVVNYEDIELMFRRFSAVQPSDFLVVGDHVNLKDGRWRPHLDRAISTADPRTNNAAYVFLETDVHAINIKPNDQRFFCLDCDSKRVLLQKRQEIKDINPIHVAHFLYNWDWKGHGFDPHAAPPMTLFKKFQMLMTRDVVARTVVPFVYRGYLIHEADESDRYMFTLQDTQNICPNDTSDPRYDELSLPDILHTLFFRDDSKPHRVDHPDWVPFFVLRDHIKQHGGANISVQKISAAIKKMLRAPTEKSGGFVRACLGWRRGKQTRVIKMPTQAQAKRYLEEYLGLEKNTSGRLDSNQQPLDTN